MKRIHVRGTSGSGKTTFARELSQVLSIPHIEMDQHFHLPGWQERPKEEFRRRMESLTQSEAWIIDGNYSRPELMGAICPDTIIWLDYSLPLVLSRIIRRTLHRVLTKAPVCNGNYETFRIAFMSRQSVIWWSLTTHHRRKRQLAELKTNPNGIEVISFRTPREAKHWLSTIA